MKPVDNTITFPWSVGDELAYIDESGNEFEAGGIRIVNIAVCRNKDCSSVNCTHLVFSDDNENEWCGIIEDFELVS